MGRGVESVGDNVIFFDASYIYGEDDENGDYQENAFADEDWRDEVENLQEGLKAIFPSLINWDGFKPYPYRESRGILENYHVRIYISEYCGCGAISVDTSDAEYPELAQHFVEQIWPKFVKTVSEYTTVLNKLGTMSNGVSVFEKAGARSFQIAANKQNGSA